MSQDKRSRLRSVYAQLLALSEDLPLIAYDHDVDTYNRLVDQLIESGYAAEDFKIQQSDMYHRMTSANSITGEKTYSPHREAHHHVLDRKVKSLLTFLKLTHEGAIVNVDLPRTPN